MESVQDPRDIVKERMSYYKWDQRSLAEAMEYSVSAVSLLLKGKININLQVATKLSIVLGDTPGDWLEREFAFKEFSNSDMSQYSNLTKRAWMFRAFPVTELINRKWINIPIANKLVPTETLREELIILLGNEQMDFIQHTDEMHFTNRKQYSQDLRTFHEILFIRKAQAFATDLIVPPYNKNFINKISADLATYMTMDKGVEKILIALNEAGVKFMVIPKLGQANFQGLQFWHQNNPVITYTLNSTDQLIFWKFAKECLEFFELFEAVDVNTESQTHGHISTEENHLEFRPFSPLLLREENFIYKKVRTYVESKENPKPSRGASILSQINIFKEVKVYEEEGLKINIRRRMDKALQNIFIPTRFFVELK